MIMLTCLLPNAKTCAAPLAWAVLYAKLLTVPSCAIECTHTCAFLQTSACHMPMVSAGHQDISPDLQQLTTDLQQYRDTLAAWLGSCALLHSVLGGFLYIHFGHWRNICNIRLYRHAPSLDRQHAIRANLFPLHLRAAAAQAKPVADLCSNCRRRAELQ